MTSVVTSEAEHSYAERNFGFWMYLMSDAIIFGLLFATYGVMRNATAGGPTGHELFDAKRTSIESLILLTSSTTFGLSTLAADGRKPVAALAWMAATFTLGAAFLVLEVQELSGLIARAAGANRSGFLSAYFTLVGTHGLHVAVGLVWIVVLGVQIQIRGITRAGASRLSRLALFWHFLDIVWIGIFSVVYLPAMY